MSCHPPGAFYKARIVLLLKVEEKPAGFGLSLHRCNVLTQIRSFPLAICLRSNGIDLHLV